MSAYDVAIIGGGPAGSTAGTLLKKYNPDLNVVIYEREVFPRDHVGESQLPPISYILEEMGCWDKVEAANFPIKVGATYRWGKAPELWDFEFLPAEDFKDEPRPGRFEGQRRKTAFQVDRAIYDEILLDHAAEFGCEVYEGTQVSKILREGDRVKGVQLEDGTVSTARYYLDASGNSGILRRTFGVECDYPTSLRNIAIWDYWQNAEWAIEIGVGGTRIQVLSLGWGWIWFIPLGPTRTSIGLVVPAEYYKQSGMKPSDLYARAISEESIVAGLLKNATSENKLRTTKDWSFLAERQCGENWFLIGESAGFADPILSAGLSMAHAAGLEVAFTIHELDRGEQDPNWLKEQFQARQGHRILNHIRFGDYWYTANAQFKDLKDFTQTLAQDSGIDLSPEKAWAWIARGGFIDEDLSIGTGGFSLTNIKDMGEFISDMKIESMVAGNNVFKLNMEGATWKYRANYANGRVSRDPCYVRGERVLPVAGVFDLLLEVLQRSSKLSEIIEILNEVAKKRGDDERYGPRVLSQVVPGLEAMITDGWVDASRDPTMPLVPLRGGISDVRLNRDPELRKGTLKSTATD